MRQYPQYPNNLDKMCADWVTEWKHKSFEQESKKKADKDTEGKKDTKE